MFTDEELEAMTYEQVHAAFQMRLSGASDDEIRRTVLPESVPEPEEEPIGIQMVKKMIALRQAPCQNFVKKWHR